MRLRLIHTNKNGTLFCTFQSPSPSPGDIFFFFLLTDFET
jgi:hypothetical protein